MALAGPSAHLLRGLALSFFAAPPDLLIARDGAMAGLRPSDGTLVLLAKKPDEYTATQWLQREGDRRDWKTALAGASCDDLGCVAQAADGKIVSLALRPGALIVDCARADVLVSTIPVQQECAHPQLAVDRLRLARDRATAVWFTQNQMKIDTVAEARGVRPWVAQYLRTRPTSLP
jgi:competence protein ComEC